MKRVKFSSLVVPAAALLALAGTGAMAQNTRPVIPRIAQPSRDPSGRTTIGQSTLPIRPGGAGIIRPGLSGFSPLSPMAGRRPLLWRTNVGVRRFGR